MNSTRRLYSSFSRLNRRLFNLNPKEYKKETSWALVGSGREEVQDGLGLRSGLAQPSGLSSDGSSLFFVDSEGSCVRRVDLEDGRVHHIAGGSSDPRNLFAFGDRDGEGHKAQMQHPLGVAWSSKKKSLFVADSYNHQIKTVDPKKKSCSSLRMKEPFSLDEPGGLYCFEESLFIADTNHHLIKILHQTRLEISTLELRMPAPKSMEEVVKEILVQIKSTGGHLNLTGQLDLPEDASLSTGAPSKWILRLPENLSVPEGDFTLSPQWSIPIQKEEFLQNPIININARMYLCTSSKCLAKNVAFRIKLEFTEDAPSQIDCHFSHTLTEL